MMRIPEDLIGKTTIDVQTAGRYYGIGRDAAYRAVKDGTIPSLRLGGRIVVPVAKMLEQLGITSA